MASICGISTLVPEGFLIFSPRSRAAKKNSSFSFLRPKRFILERPTILTLILDYKSCNSHSEQFGLISEKFFLDFLWWETSSQITTLGFDPDHDQEGQLIINQFSPPK